MNDPHGARPALPDPQRDRHVSFPDDAPTPEPVRSGETLPPEAWASRSSDPGPQQPPAASWQAPVPPVLTTPPVRRPPRRRLPGWAAFFLIPPLLLGISNNGSEDFTAEDCSYSVDAGPGSFDCATDTGPEGAGVGNPAPGDGVSGVWVQEITDSTSFAPVLAGKPRIAPVPADTRVLRVEIVTAELVGDPLEAQVDTRVGGFSVDSRYGPPPQAFEIHLDERPPDLSVSVLVGSGSGSVQCRVYADDRLVAVNTSDTVATCRPAM